MTQTTSLDAVELPYTCTFPANSVCYAVVT